MTGGLDAELPMAVRYRQLNFDRAARHYDSVSTVQKIMARRLVELAPTAEPPSHWLELGCGTGHLSELLLRRYPESYAVLTDLSVRMLERAKLRFAREPEEGRIQWLRLDASRGSWNLCPRFQLVASNALVQWFGDLASHLRAVAGSLHLGASYLVSGFLSDNLPELAHSLARFDVPPGIGHAQEDVLGACEAAGLTLVHFQQDQLHLEYESALRFFEAIAVMGASRYPGRPLPRGVLRELFDDYGRRNACPAGVTATWRPWYALVTRRR